MELAVFVACNTADNYNNGKNIVDAAHNAGATYAIGFKSEIHCPYANEWLEYLFYYYMNGHSISEACTLANNQVPSMSEKYYLAR